uniref:Uncharacterized protein n=1 Tax=Trichobilharzia regenti TaxID=157069 RepID=A0AA85JMI6_TRIRE|nr:unnamed protein product [Trichobilharzia regenti]
MQHSINVKQFVNEFISIILLTEGAKKMKSQQGMLFLLFTLSLLSFSFGGPVEKVLSIIEEERKKAHSPKEELNSHVTEEINQKYGEAEHRRSSSHANEGEEGKQGSTLSDLTTATPSEVNEYTQPPTDEQVHSINEELNSTVTEEINQQSSNTNDLSEVEEKEDRKFPEVMPVMLPEIKKYLEQYIKQNAFSVTPLIYYDFSDKTDDTGPMFPLNDNQRVNHNPIFVKNSH